jgi:hypothetical protein
MAELAGQVILIPLLLLRQQAELAEQLQQQDLPQVRLLVLTQAEVPEAQEAQQLG